MPSGGAPLAVFLVSSLKSGARLRHGEQLHALAAKSGLLASNTFVRNSLLAFYARLPSPQAPALARHLFDEIPLALRDPAAHNTLLASLARAGRLDLAQGMLAEMPQRDTVSYTTVLTALARAGHAEDAVAVFRGMLAQDVPPNEVTLAGVLTALALERPPVPVGVAHGVTVRRGLNGFLIVATNLVHAYAAASQIWFLDESHGRMERVLKNVIDLQRVVEIYPTNHVDDPFWVVQSEDQMELVLKNGINLQLADDNDKAMMEDDFDWDSDNEYVDEDDMTLKAFQRSAYMLKPRKEFKRYSPDDYAKGKNLVAGSSRLSRMRSREDEVEDDDDDESDDPDQFVVARRKKLVSKRGRGPK
ncbi:hypothetical protein ZWY2020_017506 [Hordeum vulgare]|nr:hypothetical protein ZWY2020_017506 [Hordeum vulgare]